MATKIYDNLDYETATKDIYISSTRRNKDIYPKPNGYEVNLDTTIEKITEVEVVAAQIPYTFYTIDLDNNRLYFEYDVILGGDLSNQSGFIHVNPGHYSTSDLAAEIQLGLNYFMSAPSLNGGSGNWRVGYAPSAIDQYVDVIYDFFLGKFIFRLSQDADSQGNFINAGPSQRAFTLFFKDKEKAMSRAIGFLPETVSISTVPATTQLIPEPNPPGIPGNYTINPDVAGIYLENNLATPGLSPWKPDTKYSQALVSEVNIIDSQVQHLILRLNPELNGDSYRFAENTQDAQGNVVIPYSHVPDLFGIVPINAAPGNFITMGTQSGAYRTAQVYESPLDIGINKLNISFHDENGKFLDFNGVDHSMVIRFTYMRKKSGITQFSAPAIKRDRN